MYFYQIGWAGYDDSDYTQYMHEQKFTVQEFDDIVYECVFEKLCADWDSTECGVWDYKPLFSDILNHGLNPYLEKRGFKMLKYEVSIEGGEYELLDHLIETGYVSSIENIQVQFHDFIPQAEDKMKKIQAHLRQTHVLTYQYPFVWENWRRK